MTALEIVPFIVKALGQAAAFEAGTAITIPVPAETLHIDLSAEGLGHVEVTESGTTITIKKV